MRVAVVVSDLSFGGAERQTVALLRQLRGTDWAPVRVVCLSTHATPYGEVIQQLGYPLSIVDRAGAFDLRRSYILNRLLREDEADIVHAVNWLASAYCVLARPRRARIVSSIRNSHLPAGIVRRHALPLLVRRANGILVNSERGRQFVVRQCRVQPSRVALVPNGIDFDDLGARTSPGALRGELGIPSDAPVVTYVGRNARVKNIPRLLGVVRRLLDKEAHVHVVIAGEGLDRAFASSSGFDAEPRVHFLGPRRDIPSVLSDSTLLLLTSDSEGLPNVVLEALSLGVPVVATAVGDIEQILPTTCGVLVRREVGALTAAVRRVVADAPEYRRAAAEHSLSLKASHTVQAMAEGTVDVWRRATA